MPAARTASRQAWRRWLVGAAILVGFVAAPAASHAADDDVVVEFHFTPVPNTQIAIWLTRPDGSFVRDVFVTQATGTLGIGNRPGLWDFLSSWRFPYGPRLGVLPVWAHARGRTYPSLVFHDDEPADAESLGWHENSSSPEPYFCRPLTASEHQTISTDTMTCPSPSTFQSDKGRFGPGTSVYPPRGDLISFEAEHDHDDVRMFSDLNDLDAVTRATPVGNQAEVVTTRIDAKTASEPLVAWIEVSLEADQNQDWSFDRDAHHVDPRLASFGVGYLGQPSVVFRVEFDPGAKQLVGTTDYAGYGTLDGTDGSLHPPDGTLSTANGSGADRLRIVERDGLTFRFGVDAREVDPDNDPEGCAVRPLPAMTGLELEAREFDSVRVHFTVPPDDNMEVQTVRLFYRAGALAIDDATLSSAYQQVVSEADCAGPIAPGVSTWCELDELWGNTPYQVAVRYEDTCSNESQLVAGEITTPAQEFATVDGACFIATAAWGAPWADRVQSLRAFRDRYMKATGFGWALIAFYYAHGPVLAKAIAPHPWARALARAVLEPVAALARTATASR